jgi:hypothetical protein
MEKINQLTIEEIQSLQVDAAMRIIASNSNLLIGINNEMFTALNELGQARIKVETLKEKKSTIVEQIRALKTIVQSG